MDGDGRDVNTITKKTIAHAGVFSFSFTGDVQRRQDGTTRLADTNRNNKYHQLKRDRFSREL